MRIRLESIGCRLNIAEIEDMARRFVAAGHRIVGPGDGTDLCIFNSCAVTRVAMRKSRKLLRQLRRQHPGVRLVATGCYTELSAVEAQAIGVDLIVANVDKDRLPEILAERGLVDDGEPVPGPIEGALDHRTGGRTRAFVKVQDGCDNRCTFCIVTVARGDSRSRAPDEVVAHVRDLASSGYQEVVLSGVHLGAYGQDLQPGVGLGGLVQRLLEETDIPRLRLSSLEPWDLRADFFAHWQDSRLLPHLHLPLQSGSDTVLRRMARRTDRVSFRRLLAAAREAIPDVSVSTDLIVGFPGETDAEFSESLVFTEEMAFSRLHVFRYSPRRGTVAHGLPGVVPAPVAQERSRRMHELGGRLESTHRRQHLGDVAEVLWETSEPFGSATRWSGLTGNYLRVVTDADPGVDLANRITPTELLGTLPGALYGRTPGGRQALPFGTDHEAQFP